MFFDDEPMGAPATGGDQPAADPAAPAPEAPAEGGDQPAA